jgi:hypothetical protein
MRSHLDFKNLAAYEKQIRMTTIESEKKKERKAEPINQIHSSNGVSHTITRENISRINSTITDIKDAVDSLNYRVDKIERESVNQTKRGRKKLRIKISA